MGGYVKGECCACEINKSNKLLIIFLKNATHGNTECYASSAWHVTLQASA